MTESLRERILATQDITSELVEVPEWGVTVQVRSMTARERSQAIKAWSGDDDRVDLEQLYPVLLVQTVFDPETGERVFQPEDVDTLNTKNSAALERLAVVAVRLSGMDQKAVDEAAKRFPEEPGA
jgi:hypothetical protein